MKGFLYLEDGTIYEGKGFGKIGTSIGELVFNTSITGYQEILTDPSYAGQIITMTYPLIGNYGVNSLEGESAKIYAKGFVVKSVSNTPSNYLSEDTVDCMLKKMNVVGVSGLDTRSITKKIRNSGAMKCIISTQELSKSKAEEILIKTSLSENYMEEVSTKQPIHIKGSGHKVVVIDFGVKANIIENLKYRNCDITILPYNTSYEEIEKLNPEGILLSNGPGDPKEVVEAIETVKKIIYKYPTFGICLGHQILALALNGDTYKMKYGHRGGNHGVYDIEKDKAYITSQNHGYAVDGDSIKDKVIITHKNLNDDTIEGMRHKELPVFSVQFHPEGAPGPQDSAYLFDKFISSMKS
ncbi:glutamine-hydrolyzing carbamoyl-phosphate synthase small subunit [Clostridiaceae bacterium UIB06]|uniref:Carbamoyl phosphate synthase small chain n=1 Tax=Clostridium thailandense TaxID=2794346 RepID=A0A949THF5_9CLOT|nr:glutamine-hydrolyzing carbamoyl-phosphate synthase small subunit [Clostridium thailandense]MBV7272295.1 glutamine-hydrolyzing carbamoyl-phosphate synthase small subunit [Clostridium thailandense]MCH5136743.1 glutamine-hydrolyzing carbamoyl-phosphate synthase small subunit [Clostridiaceae bacterium UIB06]